MCIDLPDYLRRMEMKMDRLKAFEAMLADIRKQEEYEKCPMEDTLDKLATLAGIEIPQEEYSEQPALNAQTAADIADQVKIDEESQKE